MRQIGQIFDSCVRLVSIELMEKTSRGSLRRKIYFAYAAKVLTET